MSIEITATTNDNAAFEEDEAGELARILREAADKLDQGVTEFILRDINGNQCGKVGAPAPIMVHSISSYEEQGRLVATHRNGGDESSSQLSVRHFRSMRAAEEEDNRQAATSAYERGYAEVRKVPSDGPIS